MSGYLRPVSVATWWDPKFRKLQPKGKLTWQYFLSAPQTCPLPGVLTVNRATIAEDMDCSLEDVDAALAELTALGMLKADWTCRLVFLPNALKHTWTFNPKWVEKMARAFDSLPESPLKFEIFDTYLAFVRELAAANPKQGKTLDTFSATFRRPALPTQAEPAVETSVTAALSARPIALSIEEERRRELLRGPVPEPFADPPPPPPPETGDGRRWYDDAQAARLERHGALAEQAPPSIEDDFKAMAEKLGEGNVWRLGRAWLAYLEDRWATSPDKRPICPWAGFRKRWEDHLPPLTERGVRARLAERRCEVPECIEAPTEQAWTDRPAFPHAVCVTHAKAWEAYPTATAGEMPPESDWQAFVVNPGAQAPPAHCVAPGRDGAHCSSPVTGSYRSSSSSTGEPCCTWHGTQWEAENGGAYEPAPARIHLTEPWEVTFWQTTGLLPELAATG